MERSELTQEYLKSLYSYDQNSGLFTRLINRGKFKAGEIAGRQHTDSKGMTYVKIKISGKEYFAHRLVWFYMYGVWPEKEIDHIDHNTINNKISNLRSVSLSENRKNISKSKKNTSGVVGVLFLTRERKWSARIQVNCKNIYLGTYACKHDAIKARKSAEQKYNFHPNHGT
jgi:hypothetical protein